jgi:hypothetical protein
MTTNNGIDVLWSNAELNCRGECVFVVEQSTAGWLLLP